MSKLNIDYQVMKTKVVVYPKNKDGEKVRVTYDPYLFGLICGIAKRRKKNWHGLILITGEVGDGKSTLGDGICGLDSYIFNSVYDLDGVVFSTKAFEEFTDKTDNHLRPVKYDEAIEGATSQDMARSSKGLSFKKKIVQKRKKKHLYVMCIDELEEYAWKLIKMADIWIHVKTRGLERGYFDITNTKWKIKAKYLALKLKQYNIVNRIRPDKENCHFMNYENIFIDDDKYQEKKDAETSSEEEENLALTDKQALAFYYWVKGKKNVEIADIMGIHINTLSNWVRKFKKITTT